MSTEENASFARWRNGSYHAIDVVPAWASDFWRAERDESANDYGLTKFMTLGDSFENDERGAEIFAHLTSDTFLSWETYANQIFPVIIGSRSDLMNYVNVVHRECVRQCMCADIRAIRQLVERKRR
jgi:hypothetical protein